MPNERKICTRCHKPRRPDATGKLCSGCRIAQRDHNRTRTARLVATGMCVSCYVRPAHAYADGSKAHRCKECLEERRKRSADERSAFRPPPPIDPNDWCVECQAAEFHRDGCPLERKSRAA